MYYICTAQITTDNLTDNMAYLYMLTLSMTSLGSGALYGANDGPT